MNEDTLRDLMRRLGELERTAVRFRAGEITDTSPLSVALGGSDIAHQDVSTVQAGVSVGDHVAALTWSNDLLVLGALGGLAVAAGVVISGGGSSYSLGASRGIASVAGQATGRCRVVLDGDAANMDSIWPAVSVYSSSARIATIGLGISAAPATFDVYQWDHAGAASSEYFTVVCAWLPA